MARPGIKSAGPGQLPFEAVQTTQFVSPGAISSAGLIPFPRRSGSFRKFAPKVLTKYGCSLWVKRAFEYADMWMAADVQEKLVHLTDSPQVVDALVDGLDWPVKMFQAVAVGIEGVIGTTPLDSLHGEIKKRVCDSVRALDTQAKR